ncbi:hypothetical protein D3C87_2156410 [compost metagenome]
MNGRKLSLVLNAAKSILVLPRISPVSSAQQESFERPAILSINAGVGIREASIQVCNP